MLSLICCDEEYSERKMNLKRKDLHDLILKELGVLENSNFEWEKSSRFMMHEVILVV